MDPIYYLTTFAYLNDPWLFATSLRGNNDGAPWRFGGKIVFPNLGIELQFVPSPAADAAQVSVADGIVKAVIQGNVLHGRDSQPAVATMELRPGKSSAGKPPVGQASLVINLPVSGNPVIFDSGGLVDITALFPSMYISLAEKKTA